MRKKRSLTYRLLVRLPVMFVILSFMLTGLLRWVPVYYTPLMLKRSIHYRSDESFHTSKKWVRLEDISPNLIQAVIAAEDQKFYQHHGFDWEELKTMWEQHSKGRGRMRGCSTISQQTAKNVFSFGSSTMIRKIWEAYWTVLIELIWDKDRIIEVYLNVAEMGPGIYGAQAAAQHYYKRSAAKLTREQSAAIACCLPNPLVMNPLKPTGYQLQRRSRIMQQMGSSN